jgi:hypothetical protein
MNSYYNLERLTYGIDTLATHPGPIKDRLVAAFHESLCTIVPGFLPEPALDIWNDTWRTVTAVPADSQEGVFRLSIDALDESAAVSVARSVLAVEILVRVAVAGYGGPELVP